MRSRGSARRAKDQAGLGRAQPYLAHAITNRCDGGAKELDCFAPLAMTGE